MSRVGSSRCRITTSFWWWEPPVRTRMSRIASTPRRCRARPRCRFSPRGEPHRLGVRAPDQAADVDAALVGPAEHLGDLAARLAGEPLVGVALPVGEEDRSPARVASSRSYSSAKYVDPCTSGRTWLPSDQACSPGCTSSSRVAGLPRSALVSSQSAGRSTVSGTSSTVPETPAGQAASTARSSGTGPISPSLRATEDGGADGGGHGQQVRGRHRDALDQHEGVQRERVQRPEHRRPPWPGRRRPTSR